MHVFHITSAQMAAVAVQLAKVCTVYTTFSEHPGILSLLSHLIEKRYGKMSRQQAFQIIDDFWHICLLLAIPNNVISGQTSLSLTL